MKLNTFFKASHTFSAEQENTYTCNSTVRFHFHQCSETLWFTKTERLEKKGSVGLQYYSSLQYYSIALLHGNVLPVSILSIKNFYGIF